MPHAFPDDERVAAKDDRDMMVPAREASALKVVEAELALEVLIRSLRSPALHHDTDERLLRSRPRCRAEEVVGRFVLAVAPLDEEPQGLAVVDAVASIVCGHDSAE